MGKQRLKPGAPMVVKREVLGPPLEEDMFSAAREPVMVGPMPERALETVPPPSARNIFVLDALWTERLERLAKESGQEPSNYLVMLIRRAFVAMPPGKR